MKKKLIIAGITLILAFATNTGINAQRGMRQGADSLNVMRHDRYMERAQMQGHRQPGDTVSWKRMHDRYAWGPGYGRMMHPYGQPYYGWRGPMHPMPPYEGWGMRPYAHRPGMGRIENIPGLTDKQKEEITAIRKQQQDEMQKFREETATRMKEIRSRNHEKMLSILTDEQKKFLEGPVTNPSANPPANPKQTPKSK